MRRRGILNAELAQHLARLGHTDTFVVADCGLPVPRGVPVVDLAVVLGVPPISSVLPAILDELEVEAVTIAEETPPQVRALLPDVDGDVREVDHEALKTMTGGAAFVVRTGETTPYANVIVQCGVPF